MTDNHSGTRSRVRRSERAQHFYAARTFSDEEIKNEEQPSNAQALDKKSASESSVTAPAGEDAIRPMTFLHRLTSRPQKEMSPRLISLPTIAGTARRRRATERSLPLRRPSSWIFPVMTIIPGMKGRNRSRKATSTVRARPPGPIPPGAMFLRRTAWAIRCRKVTRRADADTAGTCCETR